VIPLATRRRRKHAQQKVEANRTLCALVQCDQLAIAIPARTVTFIALAEETTVAEDANGRLRVAASGLVAPAWRLADLLDVDAETTSWLFLGSDAGLIALGCGACMKVQDLSDPDPLPHALFRAGDHAILGAFRVEDALLERGCGILGIWVDPLRLIGRDAIAAAIGEPA